MMSFKLSLALVSCALCLNTEAASLCEIDHVEHADGGIRVVFNQDYHPNILGIKPSGSEKAEGFNAGAPLILKEGDEAGVNQGPHDFCTLRAERKDGKLGILIKANNHIPGIAPSDRFEFVIPAR